MQGFPSLEHPGSFLVGQHRFKNGRIVSDENQYNTRKDIFAGVVDTIRDLNYALFMADAAPLSQVNLKYPIISESVTPEILGGVGCYITQGKSLARLVPK